MEELDLSSNKLEGPIPDSFFKLQSLQLLSLSNNFFNGTFQLDKIRELYNLTTLNLSYNNLSVDASRISSTFPQLYQLSLISCNLSSFPDLRNQSNLRFLDLSNNRIRGEIPNWIWEIGSGEFWQLNLSCNHFVDLQKPYRIPDSLQVLDLHSNHLRGELPLPQDRALYVDYSNNEFDKPIPINIGIYLSNLIFFSVSNNSLSGSIPTTLCEAAYLQVLDLSFNYLSGSIPPCLFENTKNLGVFNLRSNNITGDIPENFSQNCGLETLDLNGNNLGGKLPKSMENCSSLTVLNVGSNNIDDSFPCMLPSDLSSNQLAGRIPVELGQLGFLQVLNLSYNELVGGIPRSQQLDTFDYASYEGNKGLCGFPLNISCRDDDPQEHENMRPHGKSEMESNYISAEVGYAVGLGSTIWLLVFCRSWRERYFGKVEEVVEQIFERQRRKRSLERNRRRRAAMNQVRRQ